MKKKICILGGGESGVGAAILARTKDYEVFLSDSGQLSPQYTDELRQYDIPYEEGGHTLSYITDGTSEVIKSPGIPDKAPVIVAVKQAGIPLISEIEFASRYTRAQLICITGSNGKTTTTSLIYHILRSAGYNVGLAGNIGQSFARQVALCEYDYYVIELSSFQLDYMFDFRANVAILLNITPDHLDRYDYNFQNYADSKMRIIRNQTSEDSLVYWMDDPVIARELKKYDIHAHLCPFSLIRREGAIAYIDHDSYQVEYPMPFNMEQESLALHGRHNMQNQLAAGITAELVDVPTQTIKAALRSFTPVPHRLEPIATKAGVSYVNDSKATNVNATYFALDAMTTPVVLILGGTDKGNDYAEIFPLVRDKCRALVYLTRDNRKLHDSFDSLRLPTVDVLSMEDCVKACARLARSGDTVLLSPACASFDLFKNMADRGDQFREQVNKL